jgi:hypothetical protein
MKKIFATALVLGLALPTASHAATTATKKPSVKAAAGAEGTAKHETAEAATGTAEKMTPTKKTAKSTTKTTKSAKKSAKKAKK